MKNIFRRSVFVFAIACVALLASCNGNGQSPNQTSNQGGGGGSMNPQKPSTPDNPATQGEKITLKFDSKKIEVSSNSHLLPSGREVKAGTQIRLYASNFANDEVLNYWLINGNKKEELNSNPVLYTVNAGDAKNENGKKVIDISYEIRKKSKEKIKVTFANNIRAFINGGNVPINSGSSYEEGALFTFNADVEDGKKLETWFINDVDKKIGDRVFHYTLKISDAKGGEGSKSIEVRFKEVVAQKVVLKFDEAVFEEVEYREKGGNVGQNTEVLDGTRLTFFVKNDAEKEQIIDYITTNGAKNDSFERELGHRVHYYYTINVKDAKDEGGKPTINVGVAFKEPKKAILKFDSAIIRARVGEGPGAKEIQSGVEVKEKDMLQFEVKDSGKLANKWLLNGKEVEWDYSDKREALYIVSATDMKMENGQNVLVISAELGDVSKLIIKFQDGITCEVNAPGGHKKIVSGTEVEETQRLFFSAQKLAGKVFENWLINGKIKQKYEVRGIYYYVDRADANEQNVIEFSLSSRDALKAKLVLEKNDIRGNKKSGDEVEEGERLYFSVDSSLNGKVIDVWLINGKEFVPNPYFSEHAYDKDVEFYVSAERIEKDGAENVIKVDYRVREPKKVKLILQKDFIKAQRSGSEIHNGDEVQEGDSIRVSVEDPEKIAKKWRINGKYTSASPEYIFILGAREIITENAENVVKIDCEVRERQEIKIEYDTEKIECKNVSTSASVASGEKIKEGTLLSFKAKGVSSDKMIRWLIEGKNGNVTIPSDEAFEYRVHMEDKGSDGSIKISYTVL